MPSIISTVFLILVTIALAVGAIMPSFDNSKELANKATEKTEMMQYILENTSGVTGAQVINTINKGLSAEGEIEVDFTEGGDDTLVFTDKDKDGDFECADSEDLRAKIEDTAVFTMKKERNASGVTNKVIFKQVNLGDSKEE